MQVQHSEKRVLNFAMWSLDHFTARLQLNAKHSLFPTCPTVHFILVCQAYCLHGTYCKCLGIRFIKR